MQKSLGFMLLLYFFILSILSKIYFLMRYQIPILIIIIQHNA